LGAHPLGSFVWPLVWLSLATVCTAAPNQATSPVPSADIGRAKIELVFSAMRTQSVFAPEPRALLVAALEGVRSAARAAASSADVETPSFAGGSDAAVNDFRLFAQAAERIAGAAGLAPEVARNAAISGMLAVTPDCSTYYFASGSADPRGVPPASNVSEVRTDVAVPELPTALLAGGIGQIAWTDFSTTGTLSAKAAMDGLLAKGARGWIIDLRGAHGNQGLVQAASWFVPSGVLWREVDRAGKATNIEARDGLLLEKKYQLPIAIAIDGMTFGGPEVLAMALQARGRARVFGERSGGCFGRPVQVDLHDGSYVGVTSLLYTHPDSETKFNNQGLPPDVRVASDRAIEAAAAYLLTVVR